MAEKAVSYQTTNSYSTKNKLTEDTKTIWLCFHGLGYLSRYFINYFSGLDKVENYIIAPQAPSKYYQKSDFKHVGASWLTKESTKQETANVLNYIDSIVEKEKIFQSDKKLIILGYSQGVSIALRWMASRKIECNQAIIHSGGIPKELTPKDFEYIQKTKFQVWYGTQDEYLTEERMKSETQLANSLFKDRLQIKSFEGKHIVNTEMINQLGKEIL